MSGLTEEELAARERFRVWSEDWGGPAFPPAVSMDGNEGPDGMCLRDWFAGQALASFDQWDLTGENSQDAGKHEWRASAAYRQADAMIKARGDL